MLILDLNQVMLSNLMIQIGNHTNATLEENMVRHMILNTVRSLNSKFRNEFGELVIAADGQNGWRKTYFPYYKANRKKSLKQSEMDWAGIFNCMNKIRTELKEFFPYRVIHVDGCEADDIIGVLVREFYKTDTIMILSGDKDFNQLHYEGVKQYDPTRKKYIACNSPTSYLHEHILRGDASDGIPNVLSADNCFVVGARQTPMTKKKIEQLAFVALDENTDPMIKRNFFRNQTLIDLKFTPGELQTQIMESYNEQSEKDGSKLMNYFMANRLKNLLEYMNDF